MGEGRLYREINGSGQTLLLLSEISLSHIENGDTYIIYADTEKLPCSILCLMQ